MAVSIIARPPRVAYLMRCGNSRGPSLGVGMDYAIDTFTLESDHRIRRAGAPTAVLPSGISCSTTDMAPMRQLFPMVTPPSICA